MMLLRQQHRFFQWISLCWCWSSLCQVVVISCSDNDDGDSNTSAGLRGSSNIIKQVENQGEERLEQLIDFLAEGNEGFIQKQQERELQEELVPSFKGGWDTIKAYPIKPWVGEAQGALVGKFLIITGGFVDNTSSGTTATYARDLSAASDGDPAWIERAKNPITFWTHAGQAAKGSKLYMCGGYYAAHPGKHMDDCYVFDNSVGDKGEWSAIPFLPKEGRGGGALLYIQQLNSLLFTLGATRKGGITTDETDTWMLNLDDMSMGWMDKAKAPYKGNHVSAISAYDCKGKMRHFVLGGQKEEDEGKNNINLMYEYLPYENKWKKKANMIIPTGHFTAALVPYGCGFIIVGGVINDTGSTDGIFYYSIDDNKWTKIGSYARENRTPICGIWNDSITCSTGYTRKGYKRELSFPKISSEPSSYKVFDSSFEIDREGFVYKDGMFCAVSTTSAEYSGGWRDASIGIDESGALRVRLGGIDNDSVENMCGAFVKTFTLDDPADIVVEFYYLFFLAPRYYTGEYSEVLVSVDDKRYEIEKKIGIDGFSEQDYSTKWEYVKLSIGTLSSGVEHKLRLGGYNNKKSHVYSRTLIDFDNVKVTATRT